MTAIRDALTITSMHQLELWTLASQKAPPTSTPQLARSAALSTPNAPGTSARTSAVLDPQLVPETPRAAELAHLRIAVSEFVQRSRADATRQAYSRDWKAFTAWCTNHEQQALPATPSTLALYLAKLAELGRKYSSIRRARTAIGQVHAAAGLARPDRDPRIRVLERGIGRSIGTREQSAQPLCTGELARAVRALGDSARDVRDRALLLLGFAGGYRSSDLVTLDVEHVRIKDGELHVFLPRSKEDQLGRGRSTIIPASLTAALCPVRALQRWLELGAHQTGPLFRVINGARIRSSRMHPRAVTRAVQRATQRAGLPTGYSSHSLRAGLATSADARGHSQRAIQQHVGWLDARSMSRYIDPSRGDARNVVAGML